MQKGFLWKMERFIHYSLLPSQKPLQFLSLNQNVIWYNKLLFVLGCRYPFNV